MDFPIMYTATATDATAGADTFPFVRLDDVVRPVVRDLWWRQLRLGNRLPAERGVIVIDGGRP